MRLGTYFMAAVAVTMSAAPVIAAPANPASSLSLSTTTRVGSSVDHKSELAGGGLIIALVAAAGVIAGIVVVATDHNHPNSP